jgi:hypothetical protein
MRFVTTCLVAAGKTNTIGLPILVKQSLVPGHIVISEVKGGEETPITGILCRVHAGGNEVGNYGEPSFQTSNEIDLDSFKGIVDRSGKVSITITNRTPEPKRVKIYTTYRTSYGSVILEEKIDHFENLLNDIHHKGYCTRLVISFNKHLETLEFASVAEHLGSDEDEGDNVRWIQPFNVPIDSELDLEDQIYTINFAGKDLGQLYSENLNFLELRAVKKDSDKETLYMYATAYGFPHQH